MAAPTIALVEAAILTQLDTIPSLNVASYQGQDDEAGQGDPVAFPVAWPFYLGESLEYVDGPNYRRDQEWKIRVGAENYGGLVTPRTAAYALVESVLAYMANWKSGSLTGIERFTPHTVTLAKITRAYAYYDIQFTVGFDQTFSW